MGKTKSQLPLSRRGFLRLLTGAGITAIGWHLFDTYAPWVNYQQQLDGSYMIEEKQDSKLAQFHALVRYATLAASGHNTQPWKFAVLENTIHIYPDRTRRLPVVDPQDRELWMSLGCALENLLMAARAAGFTPSVNEVGDEDYITVRLEPGYPQRSPLFDAVPNRQCNRAEYDGRPLKAEDIDRLTALQVEPGIRVQVVTDPTKMDMVCEYVRRGALDQYANKAYVDELIRWLRFNKKEALASLDGLFTRCSGNPEVPRWIGKHFVSGTKPQQQADLDAGRMRSSSGLVWISSERDDRVGWVRTGQVFERLALSLTAMDIQHALMNQPIEVPEIRSQFQQAMGLGAHHPQLLVRFGHAGRLPRSTRRPLDQVLI